MSNRATGTYVGVQNEIAKLPPSYELLEFYRQKIKEHEKDKEEIFAFLNKYKDACSSTFSENEKEKLVDNVAKLKSALSDINIFIHAERQQVSSLNHQNHKLKLDMKFLEKKIQFLLEVSNMSEEQVNAYLRSSRKKEIVKQLSLQRKHKNFSYLFSKLKDSEESEIEKSLTRKLKAVEDHFSASKLSWEAEKNALLEERMLQKDEARAQMKQDQAHINLLKARVEEAQRLLTEATKKAVEAKAQMQKAKNFWLAEKDTLLMDSQHGNLNIKELDGRKGLRRSGSYGDLKNLKTTCEAKFLKRDLTVMKREIRDAEVLKRSFEIRSRRMEQNLAQLREQREADQKIFKERTQRLIEAKELLRRQRDRLQERRKKENEGFASDLKLVKEDLRKIVQQFFKLTTFYAEGEEIPNVAEIQDLKMASALARNIHKAILGTKKRIAKAESSFRNENKDESES